jgi:Cytochrome P450
VSEKQLRDDLLSMLVAGHETTGSALTWTLHLLASNPDTLQKARPLRPATSGTSSWRCAAERPAVLLRRRMQAFGWCEFDKGQLHAYTGTGGGGQGAG